MICNICLRKCPRGKTVYKYCFERIRSRYVQRKQVYYVCSRKCIAFIWKHPKIWKY